MSDEATIDLFAEDRAHEEFLKAVIYRLAREENKRVRIRFRSARGGHGKALSELRFYQKAVLSGKLMDSSMPAFSWYWKKWKKRKRIFLLPRGANPSPRSSP